MPLRTHTPVLLQESMEWLLVSGGALLVDATVGAGGHTEAILRRAPEATVFGFDRDGEALALAAERLAPFGDRVELIHSDFRELAPTLKKRASTGSTGSSRTSASRRCSSTTPRGASRSGKKGRST